MEMRVPSISLSKQNLLAATQLVVNVLLAIWLYDEYLHNPFMQMYISSLWSGIWPVVTVVLGIFVGSVGSYLTYRRGHLSSLVGAPREVAPQVAGNSENLAIIDACPFCDVALKTISEGRLQCRNCRRYFKSSLPKLAV
jgi:hypothetical protein